MAKKVYKAGVKREKGYLYYIDKKGNICKVKMARGGSGGKGGATVLVKSGIKRELGISTSSTNKATSAAWP